ncbi:MAG: efflux RND transporter periplasmic adaptor subunit [Saprospiraceae bacterium]|nr:efflux RND transporter periplasmic adaptor subunit [Saprospiraceae bacterium]
MKGYKLIIPTLISLTLILNACKNSSETSDENSVESEDLIQITQKQFENDEMTIGEISTQNFDNIVKCNGIINASPNGMAQISSQISGIVESINCSLGDYVKKGQVLCMLSSNEFIELQKDFIESAAKLKQLEADYKRNKDLFKEKIGAEKDFIAVESEYKSMKANYESLKLQLTKMNLNVSKIETAELYSEFPIVAPINAYVTSQNIVLGQFAEKQEILMEIVDVKQLQLQLSVFEKDINYLDIGQEIQFNTSGNSDSIYTAKISSIGKTIDEESRTIKCIANIISKKENLINHSFVEAKIIVKQRKVKALPSEAILKSANDYFVLAVEKTENNIYYLRKVKVDIGMTFNGFTEILNNENLKKVLTAGVYNIVIE